MTLWKFYAERMQNLCKFNTNFVIPIMISSQAFTDFLLSDSTTSVVTDEPLKPWVVLCNTLGFFGSNALVL